MYCWGNDNLNRLNTEYECSNDYTNGCMGNNRGTPALAQLPTGRSAIGAYSGGYHTCVFIDNGGLYCFGSNNYGEIGNGSTYGSGPNYVGMPVGISPQTNDRDLDHDGIFNNEDICMEGETGWTSNNTTDNDSDGCQDSSEDLDDDNDFLNDKDLQASIIKHEIKNDDLNKGYLTWLCRSLMEKQKDDYQYYMYLEHDIKFSEKNLQYWLKYQELLAKEKFHLGFFIYEINNSDNHNYSIHITKKLDKIF